MRLAPAHGAAAALLAVLAVAARPIGAQSLRGSPESVERMYREAQREGLVFHETSREVRSSASNGTLVRLATGRNVALRNVGFPYVAPATQSFVEELGRRHRAACGKPLMITSAARPATRQPANSVAESVHPTGMAVDLRKPTGRCLRWLRTTLLAMEDAGAIEATEEFHPPHFHVAVFPTGYSVYAAAARESAREPVVQVASATTSSRPALATKARASSTRTASTRTASTRTASARSGASQRYRVRPGDTLWEIARAHDVTVKQLLAANGMRKAVIRPGQRLVLPVTLASRRERRDAVGQ